MYALNSGTKGGEFYTPAEVSYMLAKIAAAGRKTVNKVYDPACGSGSLLLNFNLVLGSKNVREGFFGQEGRKVLRTGHTGHVRWFPQALHGEFR